MNKLEPLLIPTELLGLEDIVVIRTKLTTSNEIIIQVESTKTEIPCHKCGELCVAHGKGVKIKLRHLPILGRKTYIELIPPRGICKQCDDNPTTTQTLSWHKRNGRYTNAYEQQLMVSLVNSTIADVRIKEDVSDTAIQNIVDYYIDSKANWKQIKRLGILGIDEISLKKGYRDFVTLITSRFNGENKIIAVLKGREKTIIKGFLSTIPPKKRKTIDAICCDMYDGYINAMQEVLGKNIPIVVDRFHVAKLYRSALVSLRKQELKRLRKVLTATEYSLLKNAISILVKNKELYTEQNKQELELLFKYSPSIKAAYRLARQLTAIYNKKHRKETADKKISNWINLVSNAGVDCFNSFVGTLIKYKDYITNYFIARNTSGFVEGLNNKFKVLKRRCYGIVNIKHYFQRIFLDLEGYDLFLYNQVVTT